MIGVEVWWSNYAFEYVPMMKMTDLDARPDLGSDLLAQLNVGNYSGQPMPGWAAGAPGSPSGLHVACKVYGTRGGGAGSTASGIFADTGTFETALKNMWSSTLLLSPPTTVPPTPKTPGTGCHPSMPRYYQIESGTDHHTGLMMARRMINEQQYWNPGAATWVTETDPLAYRVVVVLTDGLATDIAATRTTDPRWTAKLPSGAFAASGTGNTSGSASPGISPWPWSFRDASYPETWQSTYGIPLRQYRRDGAHTTANIKLDTPALASTMYASDRTNIWFVSFRDDDPFMSSSAKGDGYYAHVPAARASDLVSTFEEIARSLPTSIVK